MINAKLLKSGVSFKINYNKFQLWLFFSEYDIGDGNGENTYNVILSRGNVVKSLYCGKCLKEAKKYYNVENMIKNLLTS